MQQIVLLLPLQDRLVSCALVSTAWSAAAAAAPVSCVELEHQDAESLQPLWQHHLAKLNCQQLSSVRLAVDHPSGNTLCRTVIRDLPAGLHAFDLSGLPLRLNASAEQLQSARRLVSDHSSSSSSSDDEPGMPAATAQAAQAKHGVPVDALASLKRLRLERVGLQNTDRWEAVVTAAFMQLTALRHLHMHRVYGYIASSTGGVVLSSMQHLTYLNITDCSRGFTTPAALKQLTALTGLQHLCVGGDNTGQYWELPLAAAWGCLVSLTALELTQHMCSSIPAPGFAALPKLRRLCLNQCNIDSAALTAVRGLQHLQLYCCYLPPQQRSQAQAPFFSGCSCSQLTHLSIQRCPDLHPTGAEASAQASAAVTASTALRELHCPGLLLECPPQQQLLQLTALSCSLSSDDSAKQLVRCCPAVQQLELATCVQPELLLPLTSLTSLTLTSLKEDELPQLLQLTGLQALSVRQASCARISDQGLCQLTALRQLTHLDVCNNRSSWSMPGCSPNSRCVHVQEVGSAVLLGVWSPHPSQPHASHAARSVQASCFSFLTEYRVFGLTFSRLCTVEAAACLTLVYVLLYVLLLTWNP
jgi:hypothetical protein